MLIIERSTTKPSSLDSSSVYPPLKIICCKTETRENMSISSSFFGSRVAIGPNFSKKTIPVGGNCNVGFVIESSSRPKKKATAHHMKTRPRKTQAWDIRRKPTVYAPLPPLPPDWSIVSNADNNASNSGTGPEAAVASTPELPAPLASE